jgi:photosystem II stability/assembly factor-like uncharacterized protein
MKRLLFTILAIAGFLLPVHAQDYFYDYQISNNIGTFIGGMHFISDTEGWACSRGGNIHHTTDGNTTWQTINYGGLTDLNDIFFINATTGWVVGGNGLILNTTDGGATWSPQTSGVTVELSDVVFVDALNGWASAGAGLGVGDAASTILRTTDGGATWTAVSVPTASININAIDFVDANTGYATGNNRSVFKTVNGGLTWTAIPVPTALAPSGNHTFYALDALNATTVVVGGSNNAMYRTTNGGTTWTAATGVTGASQIRTMCFWDANNGIAASSGRILRTTNGGVSWTGQTAPTVFLGPVSNGSNYSFYACSTPSANALYLGGQQGITLESTDGGTTWSLGTFMDASGAGIAIAFFDENIGMAGGFSGVSTRLYRTTDMGDTWEPIGGISGTAIEALEYLDANTVLATNSNQLNSGIFKSTDNGTSWNPMTITGEVSTVTSNACLDLFKVNDTKIVGCGRLGRFFKSTDGGNNWTATSPLAYAPSFSVSSTAPTACGVANGTISITNLEPNKTYSVSYSTNTGTMVAAANYTANASGVIVLENIPAGRYADFEVSYNGCKNASTNNVTLSDAAFGNFTTPNTGPTTCGGNDGQITLTGSGTGIAANTMYTVSYLYNGVLVGPTNYTANGSRQIVLGGLRAGLYSNITVTTLTGCTRISTIVVPLHDPGAQAFTPAGGSTGASSKV